jgi:hypothetical protein
VRDYKLTIASKAWKELEALPSALAQRVDAAILALALEKRDFPSSRARRGGWV